MTVLSLISTMHKSPLSLLPSITDFIRFSEGAVNNTKLNLCLKTLSVNKLQAETSIMFRLEPPSKATCSTVTTLSSFVYDFNRWFAMLFFFFAHRRPLINRWPMCCMRRTYEYAGADEPETAGILLRPSRTREHLLINGKCYNTLAVFFLME